MSKMPSTEVFVREVQADLVSLDETMAPTTRIFSMLIGGGILFWVGLAGLLAWVL